MDKIEQMDLRSERGEPQRALKLYSKANGRQWNLLPPSYAQKKGGEKINLVGVEDPRKMYYDEMKMLSEQQL